ncbi:MAG: methylmalonyl-CoA epimerase [Thermomicrobiales bacterium]
MASFHPTGMALHHVAVVVADLDAAEAKHGLLGFGGAERSQVPAQGVQVITFPAGAGWLELISPTDPDGAIARYMAKRGEGLHHVAYRVDDLQAALDRLDGEGVRLIDRVPREGVHGWKVAFIHPEACNGVLTELVQDDAS